MVDINQIDAEAEAQVVQTKNELVLEKLQAIKAERLVTLEQVKSDLNELDGHIASRTPQPAEAAQTEEVPVG